MKHKQDKAVGFSKARGFTIVELLIVVVVIATLAAITVVAYTGIQDRAKDSVIMSDIRQVHKLIEAYNAENGSYPSTGLLSNVYTDTNCPYPADSDATPGQKTEAWVPGLNVKLPQNPGLVGRGSEGHGGCYAYSSDGQHYILSAWNAKKKPSTDVMYRRLGYRETAIFSAASYYCNHDGRIGGGISNSDLTYSEGRDYYKHSYTVSNITNCSDSMPAWAQ